MPEGPELAVSRDYLRTILINNNIIGTQLYGSGRYRRKPPVGFDQLETWRLTANAPIRDACDYEVFTSLPCDFGVTIESINTHGKFMWWELTSTQTKTYLLCTYGMTGQWVFRKYNSHGVSIPPKHAAISFKLNDGEIYFNDPRHFGTIKFLFGEEGDKELKKKLKSLGPDMLNNPPDPLEFMDRLSRYKFKTLPEVLMDQRIIAGVGNYIKSESLYRAKLSPHRKVNSLTLPDFVNLYHCIRGVMLESYQNGGASIQTYINPDGTKGKATDFFKVYKKDFSSGKSVIKETTLDKRTTWWVPEVQR